MISYKTCVVVSKVSKRVFPYYIWILIIYCSFKKREVKLRELWCLTPFLTIFQLYHGYLVLLVEYTEKTTDLPQVLTNFIHNVSSNKGVLIAGIYIHTTVYINLKITPPSKPQSIELEIRSSFSTEQYNFGWEATVQSAPTFDQNVPIFFKGRESSSCVTQIRYTTPMKVVMVM
jgi:hypothetical protein